MPGYVSFCVALIWVQIAAGAGTQSEDWFRHFSFSPPTSARESVTAPCGPLPTFEVTPAAKGTQLVRVSLPFPPGALYSGMGLIVRSARGEWIPSLRVLTYHPGSPRSIRRALVTFPYEFADREPVSFALLPRFSNEISTPVVKKDENGTMRITLGRNVLFILGNEIRCQRSNGVEWHANLIAPSRVSHEPPAVERVEDSKYFAWIRLLYPDPKWPRIIEVRADALGSFAVIAHLQRLLNGDGVAPKLGWTIQPPKVDGFEVGGKRIDLTKGRIEHRFADRLPVRIWSDQESLTFPLAPYTQKGSIVWDESRSELTYLRCAESDAVPQQSTAWRRAAFFVSGPAQAPWNALFEPSHRIRIDPKQFDTIYHSGAPEDLSQWPLLEDLERFHRGAIARSMRTGDDFGNVTAFQDRSEASVWGMNRLNHCPPIFNEYYRSGDPRLRETALHWCNNFYDLSIWWGDTPKAPFGGTRYNNSIAAGIKKHQDDKNFMWRTNWPSDFCTKGYDSFFYAYEETGDPQMMVAFHSQINYVRDHLHVDRGECRNIGDVLDFTRLTAFTGEEYYRQEALRLFRELRTKLGPDNLFSQSGRPIESSRPFINDDQMGYKHPFAKPYIIGYALAGLPALADEYPTEPRLRGVVRAVADFLAESQDPLGGWRYPDPRSTRVLVSQGIEHAAQICNAAAFLESQGEPIGNLLDAIERTLRGRILAWQKTGRILSGLNGWEFATGKAKNNDAIYRMYAKPEDRDPARDYTEGAISLGASSPEGLVYFTKVLNFYLRHRPAARLFSAGPELKSVLTRLDDKRIRLIPQKAGSFIRMERPESPKIGFKLWAPEWATFPQLGYAKDQLGGMTIPWEKDAKTGALSYTLDRPEATFCASFVPALDYVDCFYTVWPKPDVNVPRTGGIGPCLQLKNGVFEGNNADLMRRIFYLSKGKWISLGSVSGGNSRNVLYLRGNPSPEMNGAMAESGWRTIQRSRPDAPLIAAISRDGKWVVGTAAEQSTSICNNANASHRCIHSQGSFALKREERTTLRVRVYLFQGDLDELAKRYEQDVVRWKKSPAVPVRSLKAYEHYGMVAKLPRFREARIQRMKFPLAYDPQGSLPFAAWRKEARKRLLRSYLTPPVPSPFEPAILAQEDRGSYVAKKIALNISADSRIPAYLLVPKGKGPFPAMIALHDHGAHFSIGKEKVVRPFDESEERIQDAVDWAKQCYGGRFIGDELAKRGYVVFAMDALFWGDRGRREGVQYEAQQALAANILQLGMSWAGVIAWDDIRSAEFVAGLPEVAPERIGAIGLSMGSNRTWHLAAASDRIAVGAAICWMGTTPTLMEPGNNQTTGYSAFSMLHPGLRNALDYPNVASIACPKPMLFFNGAKDKLFPIPGVKSAYRTMRAVWDSQGVGDRLVTKIWPVPHVFNREMQREVFEWLDRRLQPNR